MKQYRARVTILVVFLFACLVALAIAGADGDSELPGGADRLTAFVILDSERTASRWPERSPMLSACSA